MGENFHGLPIKNVGWTRKFGKSFSEGRNTAKCYDHDSSRMRATADRARLGG